MNCNYRNILSRYAFYYDYVLTCNSARIHNIHTEKLINNPQVPNDLSAPPFLLTSNNGKENLCFHHYLVSESVLWDKFLNTWEICPKYFRFFTNFIVVYSSIPPFYFVPW